MIPRRSSHLRRRAVALLMTLAFLVLITIAVVGLTVTIRMERTASDSHRDRFVAEAMAQDAVAEACAKLFLRAGSTNAWVSQPGRIVGSVGTQIDTNAASYLFSTPDGSMPASGGAGMNSPEWLGNGESFALTGTASNAPDPMRVFWIYVRKDGSQTFDDPPAYDAANPVIGRFAYWVDDESARVNLNTAAIRTSPDNPGSPSQVNLAALPGFTPTVVSNLVEARGQVPFRTVGDAKRAGADAAAAIAANRFAVTVYNSTPGIEEIVLTTQEKLAAGKPLLDILKQANTDPGSRANLDGGKLTAAVGNVYERLKRTSWPFMNGSASLVAKYGTEKTWQIAAGIVDFVRCAESTNTLVEPILYRISGTGVVNDIFNPSMNPVSGLDGDFLSPGRAPLITEMGISYNTNDIANAFNFPYWRVRYYVEVHLPVGYGLDQVDLHQPQPGKRLYVRVSTVGGPFGATPSPESTLPMQFGNIWRNNDHPKAALSGASREWATQHYHRVEAADVISLNGAGNPVRGDVPGGTTILKAGEYLTIEKDFWVKVDDVKNGVPMVTSENFEPGNRVFLSAGLAMGPDVGRGSNEHVDLPSLGMVPLVRAAGNDRLWLTLGPPGNVLPNLLVGARSLQVDDPRAATVPADWKEAAPTFCLPNSVRTVGQAPITADPPQDTDSSGKVTDVSLGAPAPKGSPHNPDGVLPSVAHLGLLATGPSNRVATPSVPWRTLRFQPTEGLSASEVPDWVLFDLFTVPSGAYAPTEKLEPYFSPRGGAAGGRININSGIVPFDTPRLSGLKAAFLNIPNHAGNPASRMSELEVENVVNHIASFNRAQHGVLYGQTNLYESVGEILEIKGVADGGEASEEVARQVANLLTTRGSVFAISAVGQSVSQSPNGTITVTAEHRLQTDVERVETNGSVEFRPVLVKTVK